MRLIIFDLDGTLINLPVDYNKLKQELYEVFGDPLIFQSIYKFLVNLNKKDRALAYQIIDKYEMQAVNKMQVNMDLKHVFRMIEHLKKAIVTLQGLKPAQRILCLIGIEKEISLLVTREYTLSRKMQIMYVVNKLGFNLSDVGFIGDQPSDEEAARVLGIKYVIVGRGRAKALTDAVRILLDDE